MENLDGMSMDIEKNEREKLKSVFPECFVEDKLDIDKLLNMCGEYITDDFERYEFKWKGKSECLQSAQKRTTGTLRPCKEESVNFDTTKNLYIEGDNLEVLKILQTSYYRKVKMIYIDPPYNTGNDFVYDDDFTDPIAKYKEITSQATKSTPENMGRFHTAWLNMMYPRLRLAANLLRDDGVCFISIDDHEVHNLRKICDEVFGEENFIGVIIQNKQNAKNDSVNIQKNHEYILAYRKSVLFADGGSKIKPSIISKSIKTRDLYEEDGEYYYINDPITTRGEGGTLSSRPNLGYTVYYNPTTKDKIAICDYDVSKASMAKDYCELYTVRNDLIDAGYIAIRPPKVRGQLGAWTWSLDKFNENKKHIIITGKPEAYSVRKRTFVSREDVKFEGGKPQFVNYIYSNVRSIWDFSTNCEIGKERIRRAGQKIRDEIEESNSQLKIGEETKTIPDIGFKVFKLDTSNNRAWHYDEKFDENLFIKRLNSMIDRVKPDRTDLDMVYEVILKLGLKLTEPVEKLEFYGKISYSVGENCLILICLDKDVEIETVKKMAELAPAQIIFGQNSLKDLSAVSNAKFVLRDLKIEMKFV